MKNRRSRTRSEENIFLGSPHKPRQSFSDIESAECMLQAGHRSMQSHEIRVLGLQLVFGDLPNDINLVDL